MAALVVLQAAQLGFITPIGVANTLEAGSQVNVSWTSPWPLTTLQLWRGPSADDGSYTVDILGENLPPTTNSYPWMAPGAESEANQFSPEIYFRLQKSDLPNECEQCVASSSVFTVAAAGAAAVPAAVPSASDDATPSATSGAETSAAEESTAATTAASMASETAPSTTIEESASMTTEEPSNMSTEAPASATTDEAASTTTEATESDMTSAAAETSATEMPSSAAESSGMTTMVNPSIIESSPDATAASEPFVFTPVSMSQFDRATELGLGIGLGLGIPILLVLMGLVVLLLHRRDRRRVQEEQFEGIFHAQTR
ncbi:hypothetical protein CBER1_06689 [Cercospora berteroae]|uniref:Uncharacterized protein n=1 Tax=Cercospora berteroae TaxID=357750 RepID=A0A2S6CFP9_9PEZI|nr:hypothetical protein CBER1_06689 [Cercospora berteroae]